MEENQQQQTMPSSNQGAPSPKKGNAGVVVLVIIIIVVVGWFMLSTTEDTSREAPADDVGEVQSGEDTTAAIDAELEGIDLGDLDTEFESIEEELEQL